ncbi:hypothetical protein JOF29_002730 [Kribbella aluminosa]|uniref:HEAT repeat protein n=1 Tax=Kribbella aluminosa TaxID=416017 RepID=A0ABS4UJ12_9ACTN|nr:hypothetical protein [Kribbella aluminosa]MBP2351647.1 hypothetical protein [Kribbella aluminosa]
MGRDKLVFGDVVVQRPGVRSGEVPDEELERNRRLFVASRCYDEIYDRLSVARVVVLRAPRGTGRRSAALRLLTQLNNSEVISLDPETEPDKIVDHLRPGCGHHLAGPVTSLGAPLRQVHLHAVRRKLENAGGYLVVTVDPDTAMAEIDDVIDWLGPEAKEIVRRHLGDRADADDLLELPECETFLSGQPPPAEAAGFAVLLAAYADGRADAGQLADYGVGAASREADKWFGGSELPLREQAFVIALAVFDKSSYAEVAVPADDLFKRLHLVEDPEHPAQLPIFSRTRDARLTQARAREYDERVAGRWGLSPHRLCAFTNPATAAVVLARVWTDHPAAREPLCDWLLELGSSPIQKVRLRVGVTAGLLACADFDPVISELISKWADSDRLLQRQIAVWALCTAVDQRESAVRRVASEWTYTTSDKRQWVAARVYGAIGGRMLELAFKRLARLSVKSSNWFQQNNVAESVAALLGGENTLAALTIVDEAARQRDAWGAVARRGFTYAAARWPLSGTLGLLGFAATSSDAWRQHARLWRLVLGDPEVRDSARRHLRRWITLAADNKDLERHLSRLLVDLADSKTAFERLEYLLRKTVDRDTDRTLPVAERLREHLIASHTERTAS